MTNKAKHIKTMTIEGIRILLIALWAYTAAMKLGNMDRNLDSMHKQFFPAYIGDILAYLIPVMAVLSIVFLFYSIRTGFLLSIGLLASFTVFILVAFADIFPGQTCACAGIFPTLGYVFHLGFNIVMLGVAVTSLILYNKQTRGEAENRYQSRQYKLFYKQHD
ncbi:hypothetical protein FXV77_10545 [Sphingobacterium phlebotomi]|uniref:Methylamine utilisation protein MauE domain-containing protein n=1 Tax=Sphingobacterium phlebotomi TaxID=2605433 RepID=A0A5D4H6K5_9SPHI|nr:MauE/DoxX family redox-associated membrane protein [Sphingobacterium phlebotomi]TYR36338.1 hypothetical protein FXV77_10545 [Sphingobacterium phlebotomi]